MSGTSNVFRSGDVEMTIDSVADYIVGDAQAAEWMNYTIGVTDAGTYTLSAWVAVAGNGGVFHIEIDGVNVTGAWSIPNTGGWHARISWTALLPLLQRA